MAKTLTLKQTGFWVRGMSRILLWGGGAAQVVMNPFHVDSLDEIPGKVNDGRFGCQAIIGAECEVFEDYEGTRRYLEDRSYDEQDLVNAKRERGV